MTNKQMFLTIYPSSHSFMVQRKMIHAKEPCFGDGSIFDSQDDGRKGTICRFFHVSKAVFQLRGSSFT